MENEEARVTPKAACSGAHRSFEVTVHTVGQCKPRNYLCEHVTALALERDLSLGFGPVDGATGELEIPTYKQKHTAHSMAPLLATPVRSSAIQHNSSATYSYFTKLERASKS